jgi:hypothetical protein
MDTACGSRPLMPPGRQHLPHVRVLVDYLADHFE